jgi:endonuclease/exonuclease/phosphatase family metal-dependent hydrolase
MSDDCDWLLIGDFNLIKNPSDRNMPGGNISEMLWFNEALNSLGVIEIPLHGRKFTWINKQMPLLLERLDWFFTSNSCTLSYPHTLAHSLNLEVSDH